jgi:subtilisin family serine protease
METNKNLLIQRKSEKETATFLKSNPNVEPLFSLPNNKSQFKGKKILEDTGDETSKWSILKTENQIAHWDDAYEFIKRNGDEFEYAEPDSSQYDISSLDESKFTKENYIPDWGKTPGKDEFAWYLDENRTQLLKARLESGHAAQKIRIAHIDTGYDPNHESCPKYVNIDLAYNYLEEGKPPHDPGISGTLKQPGHGTGTIAILAGNKVKLKDIFDDYMGGAPFAEIVPMRISNSVVLFKKSSFAKALNYATSINCDIVSMSMGGVPSKAWATAVNKAYMNGVTIVTAAGNNFSGFPVRKLVYPAKFDRVISVSGMTYNNKPYYKWLNMPNIMQGNWGPKSKMQEGLSGYTPNVPWAKLNTTNEFKKAGGGTSSATPQVAAAVALWLEKNKDFKYDYPWQKVEAVRHALFSTADDYGEEFKKVGHGMVQASDALNIAPFKAKYKSKKARVFLPLLSMLSGISLRKNSLPLHPEMMEVEMVQAFHSIPELASMLNEIDEEDPGSFLDKKLISNLRAALIDSPITSVALTKYLKSI